MDSFVRNCVVLMIIFSSKQLLQLSLLSSCIFLETIKNKNYFSELVIIAKYHSKWRGLGEKPANMCIYITTEYAYMTYTISHMSKEIFCPFQ